MTKAFKKQKEKEIEYITFEEFIEYGKTHGANIVNGMPWSFKYKGKNITHENDNCYLIPSYDSYYVFTSTDYLVTDENGYSFPVAIKDFDNFYDKDDKQSESIREIYFKIKERCEIPICALIYSFKNFEGEIVLRSINVNFYEDEVSIKNMEDIKNKYGSHFMFFNNSDEGIEFWKNNPIHLTNE